MGLRRRTCRRPTPSGHRKKCRHVLIIIKRVRTGRQVTLLLPDKDAACCDAATRLCRVERYAARRDTPAGLYEDFAYGCTRDTAAGRTETDGFRKNYTNGSDASERTQKPSPCKNDNACGTPLYKTRPEHTCVNGGLRKGRVLFFFEQMCVNGGLRRSLNNLFRQIFSNRHS